MPASAAGATGASASRAATSTAPGGAGAAALVRPKGQEPQSWGTCWRARVFSASAATQRIQHSSRVRVGFRCWVLSRRAWARLPETFLVRMGAVRMGSGTLLAVRMLLTSMEGGVQRLLRHWAGTSLRDGGVAGRGRVSLGLLGGLLLRGG